MSQYEDHSSDNDSICPYCLNSYQVEPENYSEDTQEIQCNSCGKKYYLQQIFSVEHYTNPDCELNNEEHKFESSTGNNAFVHCTVCDKYTRRT